MRQRIPKGSWPGVSERRQPTTDLGTLTRKPRTARSQRLIAGLSALTLIALVGQGLAPTAWAAYHGANGRIAFARGGDIYTIQPGGTGLRRLTSNGRSSGPRWSPTGNRIAYLRGGNLWAMNADGSHKTQITTAAPAFTAARPTWSPNGRYLAFVRTARGRSSGYLTRYDTVTRTFRTFVTSAESGSLNVTALPTAVAWQSTAEGYSALLFEGTGPLCGSPLTFCLSLLTFHSQSSYQGGDPSYEYGHTTTTRFRDPDWYPNNPPFATGVIVSVARCPANAPCTHIGIEPSLRYPLPPIVLPGGYQAVGSPNAKRIAYVRDVRGVPTIFTTANSSPGPPKPGTRLTTGTEPDWQPLPPS